jgi:hypothetical protein
VMKFLLSVFSLYLSKSMNTPKYSFLLKSTVSCFQFFTDSHQVSGSPRVVFSLDLSCLLTLSYLLKFSSLFSSYF